MQASAVCAAAVPIQLTNGLGAQHDSHVVPSVYLFSLLSQRSKICPLAMHIAIRAHPLQALSVCMQHQLPARA